SPCLRLHGRGAQHRDGAGVPAARWYDPASGTFLGRDPWAGEATRPASLNQYVYTENDPVNAIDPTGWATFRIWTAAFIAPESIQFIYPKAPSRLGLWEGDGRDFWDRNGSMPSSRIWAEVTVDTEAPTGSVVGSERDGVGLTRVHYLDEQGNVQTDEDTGVNELNMKVARDRNYPLVRIDN
ncbi:MAG: hypothetical protein HC893_13215, partial [Chloroflexaceae bacterium]|nr:hypothetical protein [Chloroflexaceae bacterium]